MGTGSSSEKHSCGESGPDALCHRWYAPLRSENRASQTLQSIRSARAPKAFPTHFLGNPFDIERKKSEGKVELIPVRNPSDAQRSYQVGSSSFRISSGRVALLIDEARQCWHRPHWHLAHSSRAASPPNRSWLTSPRA